MRGGSVKKEHSVNRYEKRFKRRVEPCKRARAANVHSSGIFIMCMRAGRGYAGGVDDING